MIRESVAILVIGVLMLAVLARAKYFNYVVAVTPILVLPVAHLIIRGVLHLSKGAFFGVRQQVVIGFVDLLAVLGTGILIMALSQKIESKATRRVYQVMLIGYTVILGWAYIYNTLQPLF